MVRNVAQLTTLPTEHRARRTAWTATQAREFLALARKDPLYPAFLLGLLYGLRRGEIAALRWDDVDFTDKRITVDATLVRVGGQLVRGPTKTVAGERALPLVPLAQTALTGQRARHLDQRVAAGDAWQDTGYVFTTRTGRPVEPRNISRSFDRLVESSDLPRIVFHDLRRTAATLLKDLGVRRGMPR